MKMKYFNFSTCFLLLIPASFFLFSCKKDPVISNPVAFEHFYGTTGDEIGRTVRVAAGGDIIVSGYGAGPNGGDDFILMRTDKDGNQKWIKYYGGAGSETAWSMDATFDGGFILGGCTTSFGAGMEDFYIVKTDADGNVQWTKTYGGIYDDDAIHVRCVPGGYFLSGISNNGHDENAWMLRLNQNGDSLWSYTVGGNGGDGAMYSCAGTNGDHVVVGYTNSTFTNSTDGFLLLLNDSGRETAFYNYGTPGYDEPHSVVPALDGNGWIISGHEGTTTNTTTHNVFVRAIANDGTERWDKLFGGVAHDGSEDMCAYDNAYTIVGRSNSRTDHGEDVYFLQVNLDGSLKKENWFGTTADDAGYGIIHDGESFIISGYSRGGSYGGKDIYLERILE
jgi:hypothetical protein